VFFLKSINVRITNIGLGFMQVGHDLVTSANCKSQLQFQQTNIYHLLYLTSPTYFQSAAVMADGTLFPHLRQALLVVRQLGHTLLKNSFPKNSQSPFSLV
jgi:hypothetical protein